MASSNPGLLPPPVGLLSWNRKPLHCRPRTERSDIRHSFAPNGASKLAAYKLERQKKDHAAAGQFEGRPAEVLERPVPFAFRNARPRWFQRRFPWLFLKNGKGANHRRKSVAQSDVSLNADMMIFSLRQPRAWLCIR
jgi:hypothetical protein